MIQLIRGDNDCCNLIEKRYYDRYFADDLFKFTSLYENGFLLILRNWFPTHILELELENCLFDKKKYKHDTISHRIHDSMFFFVGRPLQRRWAHRLRKGHPRLLQCINRHCTMKGQTFGSVGKLNTHTSWDRAPSRLTRGTQLTIIMRGKETKTSVLNTTS